MLSEVARDRLLALPSQKSQKNGQSGLKGHGDPSSNGEAMVLKQSSAWGCIFTRNREDCLMTPAEQEQLAARLMGNYMQFAVWCEGQVAAGRMTARLFRELMEEKH